MPRNITSSIHYMQVAQQKALNLTRLTSPCYNNTTCMHIHITQWKDKQINLTHTKKSI